MGKNIVTAIFSKKAIIKTEPIYQYDYGMILRLEGFCCLPETFEVHFSNDQNYGHAKTSIGTAGDVPIPDEYLTTGRDVWAWIILHETEADGESVFLIHIPIIKRAKLTNEEPTPVQQDAITQAIAALHEATGKAEEAQAKAEEAAYRSYVIWNEFKTTLEDGELILDDGDASDLDDEEDNAEEDGT